MPTYDYKCDDCEEVFEVKHTIAEKWEKCNSCGSKNIKKLISAPNFFVKKGSVTNVDTGYRGKHRELVQKMKGNKDYRDGYNRERAQQTKKGLAEWKEDQKMNKSNELFQKMKAEGEKMTKAEKEQIKKEFGIKKGMKAGRL